MTKKNKILSDISVLDIAPFPYTPEKFTKDEKRILFKFFTNINKPVFAIFNLPQEVVGAMFSRYSRAAKSVRRLFLDEFYDTHELGIKELKVNNKILSKAFLRTQDFYKKVFAEFGDDSVIQMGSVHIAFEFISQIIGAKAVEDQRVASSYIEKSTRYVDFGSKVNGHYLFMEPLEIIKSPLRKEFIEWNNNLFEAYVKFLPVMIDYLHKKYPLDSQIVEDTKTSKLSQVKSLGVTSKELLQAAYNRALKAKALDTVRFFLPLTTVTNLGAHFSGQAAELTVNKMLVSNFHEARYFGKMAYEELLKVSPNFLQNVDHKFGIVAREYRTEVRRQMVDTGIKWGNKIKKNTNAKENKKVATLIDYDRDVDIKIASEILFTASKTNLSKEQIVNWTKAVKKKDGKKFSPTLLKIISESTPERSGQGRSRRQKLPRAFEHVYVEIELYTDIGAYKDLQRNRLSSTEKQIITTDALYVPEEYDAPELKDLLKEYLALAKKTEQLNRKVSKLKSISRASEYVAIMGNRVRYTVRANLRQWCFFMELRTISGGHPTYRYAMQEAAKLIIKKLPFMEKYFANIDWTQDYGLGRLKAEISTQEKLSQIKKMTIEQLFVRGGSEKFGG